MAKKRNLHKLGLLTLILCIALLLIAFKFIVSSIIGETAKSMLCKEECLGDKKCERICKDTLHKDSKGRLVTEPIPYKYVTVYFNDGSNSYGYVGKMNDNFAMANVNNGPAGAWMILQKIDGKWMAVGDAEQAYPCQYFTKLGMTVKDIEETDILQRNSICLPRPSEDDFKNWDSNPSNFPVNL